MSSTIMMQKECIAVLENQMMESLLFYANEYPQSAEDWLICFKDVFEVMVEDLIEELKNNNEK